MITMRDTEKSEFVSAVGAVLEVYGAAITPAAMSIWWEVLRRFELHVVRDALGRHVQNPQAGRFAPKPADVVREIESLHGDGRPGPDEAWAMIPKSEHDSAMMTAEMREAWRIADPLLEWGDKVAPRMAFREVDERAVAAARASGIAPEWEFSAGWDRDGRIPVLADAVRCGRIGQDRALTFLTHESRAVLLRAVGAHGHPALAPPDPEQQARLAALAKGMIGG